MIKRVLIMIQRFIHTKKQETIKTNIKDVENLTNERDFRYSAF